MGALKSQQVVDPAKDLLASRSELQSLSMELSDAAPAGRMEILRQMWLVAGRIAEATHDRPDGADEDSDDRV